MFLKAGLMSLTLLVASRLLGLARESALAAAFGTSALADVAVLMVSLPDLLTGLFAAGALSYVLLPHWAGLDARQTAQVQRTVALWLMGAGVALLLAMVVLRAPLAGLLLPGLSEGSAASARTGLVWAALALPAALLAALWSTRLQHERDFTGLYGASLVINAVVIAAIAAVGLAAAGPEAVMLLGAGLVLASVARLIWLRWRLARVHGPAPAGRSPAAGELASGAADGQTPGWPAASVWLWAALAVGLPLALPFAARSIASLQGEGQLATFGYAWKLVELPQVLAIQLVATLALPAISRAQAAGDTAVLAAAVRQALALAFVLGVAAQAALMVAGPALADLLFGWGRITPSALREVGRWASIGSWCLPPMALLAVAAAVLAARRKMAPLVLGWAAALLVLLWAAQAAPDGRRLMALLALLTLAVAVVATVASGALQRGWLPWSALATATLAWSPVLLWSAMGGVAPMGGAGLLGGAIAAAAVLLLSLAGSEDLRAALRR